MESFQSQGGHRGSYDVGYETYVLNPQLIVEFSGTLITDDGVPAVHRSSQGNYLTYVRLDIVIREEGETPIGYYVTVG